MTGADPVITLAGNLDDHLGSGSPAAFPETPFVRIANGAAEPIDSHRGDPELPADAGPALEEVTGAPGNDAVERDPERLDTVRSRHRERVARAFGPAPGA